MWIWKLCQERASTAWSAMISNNHNWLTSPKKCCYKRFIVEFGIRIENLVIVKEAETEHSFMDKTFCEFETITIIPLARDMIVVKMLDDKERKWVDNYHDRCWCMLSGSMQTDEETSWLREQTLPLWGENSSFLEVWSLVKLQAIDWMREIPFSVQ